MPQHAAPLAIQPKTFFIGSDAEFIMKPILKFALYGRKESGKTCILAALSMAHLQANGFTVSRIPNPENHGHGANWEHARQRLDATIESISSGKKPEATQLTWGIQGEGQEKCYEPDPFLFRFATEDHESFDIELIDYAGELINPAITRDQLVTDLRNRMKQMDALFILVEIPKSGSEDPNKECLELIKLNEALHTIETNAGPGGHFSIPISLLLTKFDRLLPPAEPAFSNPEKSVQDFLSSPKGSFAKTFHDSLKNIAQDGHFRVFPVSAFGKSTTEGSTQIERPLKLNPLQSLGLEDPFIWASRLIAEIRFQTVQGLLAAVSEIKPWSLPSPLSPISEQASEALYLVGSEKRPLAKALLYKSYRAKFFFVAWFLAMTVSLLFSIEALFDKMKLREIGLHVSDLSTDSGKLQADADWLRAYSSSSDTKHVASRFFLLSRGESALLAKSIQESMERRVWGLVLSAASPEQTIAAIQGYTSQYPNGSYIQEANAKIAQIKQTQAVQTCRGSLEALKVKIMELASSPAEIPPERFTTLEDALNQIGSGPALNDSAVLTQVRTLRQTISSSRLERQLASAKSDFDVTMADIESLLCTDVDKKWNQALTKLIELRTKAQHLPDDFQNRWKKSAGKNVQKLLSQISVKRTEYVSTGDFDTAHNLVRSFIDSSLLKDLLTTIGDQGEIKTLSEFEVEIAWQKTEGLYRKLIKYRNEGFQSLFSNKAIILRLADDYILDSTRPNMDEVRKFRDYVFSIDANRTFKVNLKSITWPTTYYGQCVHKLMVSVGNSPAKPLEVTVPGGELTSTRSEYFPVDANLTTSLQIIVAIEFNGWRRSAYAGSESFTAYALAGGKDMEAKLADNPSCLLHFQIDDNDEKRPIRIPALPEFVRK